MVKKLFSLLLVLLFIPANFVAATMIDEKDLWYLNILGGNRSYVGRGHITNWYGVTDNGIYFFATDGVYVGSGVTEVSWRETFHGRNWTETLSRTTWSLAWNSKQGNHTNVYFSGILVSN